MVAESYVAQNDDLVITDVALEASEGDSYAIALPKGSTELQEELNSILKELIEDGTIDEYVQKEHRSSQRKCGAIDRTE